MIPPPGVNVLHIFGDNDSNYVGQAAAFALAKKVHATAQRQGRTLKVEVWIPDNTDSDWLDALNARRAAAQ